MTFRRFCLLVLLPGSALAAANLPTPTFKQDLSWTHYVDPQGSYCVEYPKRWVRQDVADGGGIAFSTGIKRYSTPTGEMDVTVAASPDDSAELLQAHLDGMKKFARAEHIEVLDRQQLTIDGNPATLTKDSYNDALEKKDWTEEIVVTRHNDKLYRLEMVCRSDQVSRFEVVFGRLVRSFAFDCERK